MKALTILEAPTVILGLQDEIRRTADARYDHRVHGVLLVAQGMNCGQVAGFLGDGVSTVQSWVHRFERNGLAGLSEGMRPGRPSRLKSRALKSIEKALRQRSCDFGLSGNLRDGKLLAQREENKFNGQTFWDFLQQLEIVSKRKGQKIALITDNAR